MIEDEQLNSDHLVLRDLCIRLKKARLNANIKQGELESLSGVSLRTIKRIESGAKNSSLLSIIAIARALNLTDQVNALFPIVESPIHHSKSRKRVLSLNVEQAPNVRIHGSTASLVTTPAKDSNSQDSESNGWVWGDEKGSLDEQ